MHPQRTAPPRRRDLVLVPHGARRRILPVRTVLWLPDAPGAIPGYALHELSNRTVPVTTPGYHKGRPSARRGKTYPATPPTPEEVLRILDAFPLNTMVGRRNHAQTVLLWRTGLRVAESIDLIPGDIDFANNMLTVRCGKGGKRGLVGIDDRALKVVGEWLDELAWLGHQPHQPIFCVLHNLRFNRAWCGTYRDALVDATRRAGINKRVVPHQLRHALAVELAREGVPVPYISKQLRHSNVATTSTYLAGIAPMDVVNVMVARAWPGATS